MFNKKMSLIEIFVTNVGVEGIGYLMVLHSTKLPV